ncbi:MAG: flagellar basal body-associated FliL family protein [Betaproteobacteria bacterium]
MAKSPKAEAEAAPEVAAPKAGSKKKLILIGAGALLLVASAAGGTWFAMRGSHEPATADGAPVKAAKKEPKHADKGAPPVFLPLESFVVNLHSTTPQAGDQFLQTEMTLRLADESVVMDVKQNMPEVRNRVLMLLSSKTAQELLTAEGKAKLAEAVRVEITSVVDPDAPRPAEKPAEKTAIKKVAGEGEKNGVEKTAAQEEEPAEAAEGEEAQSPEDYKVKRVLFTSFIIQ